MGAELQISLCRTAADRRRFERVAEELHRSNAAFVPPFPGSTAKLLSQDSAFYQRHGTIMAFIATKGGRPVGRIAAILNRSHNRHYNDRSGFFGFFECENNQETASALFEKAGLVLREAGMDCMRGPYNPSINDECGLLLSHFDVPPMIGLSWNPQYYERLLRGSGLSSVRALYTMNLPLYRLGSPKRFARIVERIAKRCRLSVRRMDISKLDKELEIVREVYNATLERNWGFVPIAMEDLMAAADDIRAIADPSMLLIAEMEGRDAGVAITLPNFNEILIRVKSTPRWLRLPHILFLMKTQRITACRQTVLGVLPACRDRGIHAWLIHEQFVRGQERYSNATLGWIEADNVEIIKNCEAVGGERDRRWDIFQKSLVTSSSC